MEMQVDLYERLLEGQSVVETYLHNVDDGKGLWRLCLVFEDGARFFVGPVVDSWGREID